MVDPTFRLEGVVRVKDTLEDFEGPLTLILQLLSKNKIEIRDIPISKICDQYLASLDRMRALDLEVASEFVAMASYLVYLKTRTLLQAEQEVEELQELMESLETLRCKETYLRIRQNLGAFGALARRGGGYISRGPEPLPSAGEYRYFHEKTDLLAALRRVFDNGSDDSVPFRPVNLYMPRRVPYPISEKSAEILDTLRLRGGRDSLRALFRACTAASELVAAFVSILELCRDGRVLLTGEGPDLMVEVTGGI